jgi:hypothetical protein
MIYLQLKHMTSVHYFFFFINTLSFKIFLLFPLLHGIAGRNVLFTKLQGLFPWLQRHWKLTFVCSRNYFLGALTTYVLWVATFHVPRSGADMKRTLPVDSPGTWAHSSLISARFNWILSIWRVALEIYLQYAPGISLKKNLPSNRSLARSRLEPTSLRNRTYSSIVKSTRWASSARNTHRGR